MRSLLVVVAVCLCAQPVLAQSFQSHPTEMKRKIIYARAEGEVAQVNLRDNQVFGWDELAVSINPSQNVRSEFGRAYTDFAGAVSEVLVKPGDQVQKGDPLLVCRFVEQVYTSCHVPSSLIVEEDQPIKATHNGEVFEGKVLSVQKSGEGSYVSVVIYNQHQEHYWHLTHGVRVTLKF